MSCTLTLISGPETYRKLETGEDIFDFTAVYVVREYLGTPARSVSFFSLDSLPSQVSASDRRALHELRRCWGIC